MSDFFGALQVPSPPPSDPATSAAGDPFLDTLAAFLQAALNADLGDLWAAIHPAVVQPHATPLPIAFTFTHDPDESSFGENTLPALYVWRADVARHLGWTQSWAKEISNVSVLWIPPLAQDEHRRIRHPFRNAFAKALARNLERGRNPAWIVDGDEDEDEKAEDYGSLFIRHAGASQYKLLGVRPHELAIEHAASRTTERYDALLGTIEVHELLVSALDDVPEISHIQGGVTLGDSALAFASYKFQPSLLTCTPATGGIAGGTSVTLTGAQFTLDENDAGLTVTLDDGTELEDVEMVDESTITATMPAHAAGVVGLVATMPSGATAELAAAFTYA